MELQFFCTRWGSEALNWASFCKKVKDAGYAGVEAGVTFDEQERKEMKAALTQYGLLFIGQYYQSFEKDFDAHKASYLRHLQAMTGMQPVKIDAQTGKDYFSFEQNRELFEMSFAFSKQTGIPVAHETHRNKALFAAHITKTFLQQIPGLYITADFSHWCNVAESFLEDQQEALAIAIFRSIHIHARVGHTQAAQVIDPRLPEYEAALQYHTAWWKQIIHQQKKAGATVFTITPEFGPAPYMPHVPFTLQPLANQWEINCWMKDYLKKELSPIIDQ